MLKLRFCKKVTIFYGITLLFLICQSSRVISSNFGALSEYMNFVYICFDVIYISLTCLFCFSSHSNNNATEQFQINLTASCNFGCACDMNDVQPVCGANGLTYFSPCHAGCTSSPGAKSDNYTNCACKYSILWNCRFRKIQKKILMKLLKISWYRFNKISLFS